MQIPIRIFKTRSFYRWQRKTFISDKKLIKAIVETQNGLIDAELGGGLIKKRVAGLGFGKSSSYRTIIATNKNDRWYFIFGFSKNEQDNIDSKELEGLKKYAKFLLDISPIDITHILDKRELMEINYG